MSRAKYRLCQSDVDTLPDGNHHDGGGLYLQKKGPSGRSWIFKYWVASRERDMGLGSAFSVSLDEARGMRDNYLKQIRDGIDPINHRRRLRNEKVKALEISTAPRNAASAASRKLTRYFPGKPCPKGHLASRYVSTLTCCECVKIKNRVNSALQRKKERAAYKALKELRIEF